MPMLCALGLHRGIVVTRGRYLAHLGLLGRITEREAFCSRCRAQLKLPRRA